MPPTPAEASPPHPTREQTAPRNHSQVQGYQPTSAGAFSQAVARFAIGMQKTGRAKNKSPKEKSRRRKKGYEAAGGPEPSPRHWALLPGEPPDSANGVPRFVTGCEKLRPPPPPPPPPSPPPRGVASRRFSPSSAE